MSCVPMSFVPVFHVYPVKTHLLMELEPLSFITINIIIHIINIYRTLAKHHILYKNNNNS